MIIYCKNKKVFYSVLEIKTNKNSYIMVTKIFLTVITKRKN